MGKKQKFIFVTGGVLSGVGKGITAASMGALLQAKGAKVSIQKCDPYLNVDAGRLDPKEHGEVFVTTDGAETDLDLGHYERFLDIELTRKSSTLSGQLLLDIINDERTGKYNGKTVQLVPHLTNAIQEKIHQAAEGSDIHIVEIGGTVGDYEALSFIEAIREFAWRVGRDNCLFIHVVYAPFLETSKEFKTKPAQNALNDLRSFGITPDGVIVRSEATAPAEVADKIALYGGLDRKNVQLMPNVDTVFRIPELLASNGIHKLLSEFSKLDSEPDLSKWQQVIARQTDTTAPLIKVGLATDCLDNEDAHLSTIEAIKAAAWSLGVQAGVELVSASHVDERRLADYRALVVPDGLGKDSLSGATQLAKYAYGSKLPFLGVGSGFLAAVQAVTDEAIDWQIDMTQKPGGCEIKLINDSQLAKIYAGQAAHERQRRVYMLNTKVLHRLESSGLVVSGVSDQGQAVQLLESTQHPFFIASQARLDFASRPYRAQVVFEQLLASSIKLQTSSY